MENNASLLEEPHRQPQLEETASAGNADAPDKIRNVNETQSQSRNNSEKLAKAKLAKAKSDMILGYPMTESLDAQQVLLAATLVQDAVAGRNMSFKTDACSLRAYILYNHPVWKIALSVCIWGNLLLALCEEPAVESIAVPYWGSMILEVCFLSFFVVRFLHYAYFTTPTELWKDRKNVALLITMMLTAMDMVCYVLWINLAPQGAKHPAVRWSRPLRVLYLINFPEGRHLRKAFRNMRRTLPDIFHVLVLFFSSIAIFSLLAYKLMETRELVYPRGSSYFSSYWECLWDLYILVTTANNPDVMMPAYDSDNWFALFFVIYTIINLYIFMNIVLAVVYNNYKRHLKNEVKATVYMKRQLLSRAFDLLKCWQAGHYVVTKESWQQMMHVMSPKKSKTQLDLLLCVLDDDGDCNIEKQEFLKVADLLAIDLVEEKQQEHVLQRMCPGLYYSTLSQAVKNAVNTQYFQHVFDVLIFANAICIGLDLEEAEYFFLPVFSIEICLKLYALGPRNFFTGFWNVFDFAVVFGAVVVTAVFSALDFDTGETTALDVLMVVRVLRLVRLISAFERFQVVLTTIVNIGPSIATYGAVIFVLYYAYAIIGMEIFRGLIHYHGYTNMSETELICGNARLNGSEFLAKHYCSNNFNNIIHAFVLLFELMVVNQWHVLTSGFVLVTNKAARLYFISFHLLCVLILLNILTAFILEVFILEYSLSKTVLVSTIEARIKDMGLGVGQDPIDHRSVKTDKQVLVDAMEAEDTGASTDAACAASTEVIEMDSKSTHRGLVEEPGLRFRLKTSARKKVLNLLELMFEGEIEPLDEGEDDTAENMTMNVTLQTPHGKKMSLDSVT